MLRPLFSPVFIGLALGIALAGCSRHPQGADAGARAQAIAGYYGHAETFTADLRVIANPSEGEMLAFSLSLWAPSDGRIRVSCKKFNVGFLEGMVEADGSFVAVLVRDEAIVRGQLSDIAAAVSDGSAAGGAAFSELATMTAVLRHGPLANANQWRWHANEAGEQLLRGTLSDDLLWEVSPRGQGASHSRLLNPTGDTLFSLRYTHEAEFERLIRPQGTHLEVVGDDTRYLFRLQRLVPVPGISANSLALTVPEQWRELSIEEFLSLLVAPEPS